MLRNWGVNLLNEFCAPDEYVDQNEYSVIYTAEDHVRLTLENIDLIIPPENFYFIPPGKKFQINDSYETAALIWFRNDLLMDRMEFLYQLENGFFFKNPVGIAMPNTFIPYKYILKNYYLPLMDKQVNKLLKRNTFINFIEFLLLRSLIEVDPLLDETTKNSYEKTVAEDFSKLLSEDEPFSFKMTYYAEKMHISRHTLDNAVKKVYGCSAKKFVTGKAVEKAKKMLLASDIPIKNISQEIGFSEEPNFHNFFKTNTGFTPKEYRVSAKAHPLMTDYVSG